MVLRRKTVITVIPLLVERTKTEKQHEEAVIGTFYIFYTASIYPFIFDHILFSFPLNVIYTTSLR
jgi:hypothetical protein